MHKKIASKEKKPYGKVQYVLLTILSVVSLFLVSSVLLTCMTLRYYITSSAIPEAVAKIVIQEIKIPQADGSEKSVSEYLLDELLQGDSVNTQEIEETLNGILLKYPSKFLSHELLSMIGEKSKVGFLIKIAVSLWIEILLGILMLLILFWMIRIQIRAEKRIGTGLKIYSITTVIPCVSMFFGGLLLTWIFKLIHLPPELGAALRGKTILISCMGILTCVFLFCAGVICHKITAKKFHAQMPVPESIPDMPAPESTKREFCRFCGEKLVNPDAQFCYQCGSRQF